MTTRRRTPKRASSANGADPAAVLLEEVRSQMKVVIEAVQDCATKRELAVLSEGQAALSEGQAALREGLAALSGEIKETRTGLAALRTEVTAGFHAIDLRFDVLTAEVARKADALPSTH